MNKKILFLGAIISSCVIAFISGQSMADYRNPNMPSGGYRTCDGASNQYAQSPYSYGNPGASYRGSYGYSDMGGSPAKPLQTESTEKIQGTISSLNRVQYPDGNQVEMILDTAEGQKRIMLGPSRFIDQARVKVQSGDKVTVKGYPIGANGNKVFMAQEVDKNGFVLKLRDDQRQPMWTQPQYLHGGTQSTNGMMGGGSYSYSGTPSTMTSNPHPYSPVNRGY